MLLFLLYVADIEGPTHLWMSVLGGYLNMLQSGIREPTTLIDSTFKKIKQYMAIYQYNLQYNVQGLGLSYSILVVENSNYNKILDQRGKKVKKIIIF